MYWWNVDALAAELREDATSEQDKMGYLLADTVITGLAFLVPRPWSPVQFVAGLMGLGISAFGILLCFEANRRGDGKRFVERFVCIGWPITVRVLLAGILAAFLIGVPAGVVAGLLARSRGAAAAMARHAADGIGVTIQVAMLVWLFLWVRSKLHFISSRTETA